MTKKNCGCAVAVVNNGKEAVSTEDQPQKPSEYTKMGGEWLGAARSWVQWNCRNGNSVTWGSGDVLSPPLTIRQVEDLAARVADAANSEADELMAALVKCRSNRLKSEIKLCAEIDRLREELDELYIRI